MAVFYLDSFAVLKRYRTEKGTDVIDALYESVSTRKPYKDIMEALRERRLATSHFTCLEVESVAARTLKGKSLIDYAYSTLLGSFARDLQEYVEVQSFDGDTLNRFDRNHAQDATAPPLIRFSSPPRCVRCARVKSSFS